jgi:DNA-binding beta-propeller fold protein YncE
MVKVWGYNDTCEQSNSNINQPSLFYVFVKQWGSMGRENGQFGGLAWSEDSTFIITDKSIESLKNQIIDEEKLKILETMKDRKIDNIYELSDTLKESKFNYKEISMVGEASALKKVSDKQANGPLFISVDKSDNIYVSDLYNCRIQKFDSQGNFLTKWSHEFGYTHGIAVDPDDYVYVVDGSHRVQKFDSQGNFILKWGNKGQFDTASAIAADLNGYIDVIDNYPSKHNAYTTNSRLQKFDSNGNFINQWELLSQTSDIAINPMGYIFLTHYANGTSGISKYESLDNTYTRQFKWFSLKDKIHIIHIAGLAIDKECNFFVVDRRGSCIYKFDSELNLLTQWGSYGTGKGEFNRPEAVAVDSNGNVYVMDTGNHRIQKFAPKQKED